MMKTLLVWSLLLLTAALAAWGTWPAGEPARERLLVQRGQLARLVPLLGGLLALGALIGLRRREHVRRGDGYSSPMIAWIGKRVFLAGACAIALFASSPLAVDPAWILAAGVAIAAGSAAYAGNLPTRL